MSRRILPSSSFRGVLLNAALADAVHSTLNNGEVSRFECDMREDELLEIASKGQFWSYAAGVCYELKVHHNVGWLARRQQIRMSRCTSR